MICVYDFFFVSSLIRLAVSPFALGEPFSISVFIVLLFLLIYAILRS